jgi:DNA-directed RNA polymerase specialized sigma24 family protein
VGPADVLPTAANIGCAVSALTGEGLSHAAETRVLARITAYARQLCPTTIDARTAEDFVNDAWGSVTAVYPQVDETAFAKLLRRSVRNLILDAAREEDRHGGPALSYDDAIEVVGGQNDTTSTQSMATDFDDWLTSRLTPLERDVVGLIAYGTADPTTLAGKLGANYQSARNAKSRALAKLRPELVAAGWREGRNGTQLKRLRSAREGTGHRS